MLLAYTGFPCVLENLENNKYIFQVLDISLNFTKSGKNIACEKIHLEQNNISINVMPIEENFYCRRKRVLVHSLDIPC